MLSGQDAAPNATNAEALIRGRLDAFMALPSADEAAFEQLALAVFAHQFERDGAYRRFARQRGRSPRTVRSWRDIPAVPITAFKDVDIGCTPPERAGRTFMTSGTTRAGRRGRIHHGTLELYDRSTLAGFARFFMGDMPRVPMAVLFPDEAALPHSSLAHYLGLAMREFGTLGSRGFVDANGIDAAGLVGTLRAAEASGGPFALLGASYALVQFLDFLDAGNLRFCLPEGSRILDTGGFKGQSREVPPAEFYGRLTAAFGVPPERCINMYGMTELSSQLYDAGNARIPSVKRSMHWLRSRVVDPLTGRDVPPGVPGVLAHHDLAHLGVVSAILTEDLGVAAEDGILLLGRVGGAEAKGCSLALEAFLEAARSPGAVP